MHVYGEQSNFRVQKVKINQSINQSLEKNGKVVAPSSHFGGGVIPP